MAASCQYCGNQAGISEYIEKQRKGPSEYSVVQTPTNNFFCHASISQIRQNEQRKIEGTRKKNFAWNAKLVNKINLVNIMKLFLWIGAGWIPWLLPACTSGISQCVPDFH